MLLLLEDALRRQAVPPTQTDWARLRSMTDADIQRGIDADPVSAPAASYEETKASYTPHPPRMTR
jgi:hypothetical protein